MLSAFIFINIFYFVFIGFLTFSLGNNTNIQLKSNDIDDNGLSLIIPVRNELSNLRKLTRSIEDLSKRFKNLEVLIIDDNSNDGSTAFLKQWASKLPQAEAIELIYLTDGKLSKKNAINKGLEKSKNDWIIQSDADCDLSVEWLNNLIRIDKSSLSFIAGPVAFKSNGFWSDLVKLESWALIAVSYFGFKIKAPQMCSAANMCWDKSKLRNKKYSEIINIEDPSGDDTYLLDFFKSKNMDGIKYNWDPNSIIWTKAPESLILFIHQRMRWASKWGSVKGISQILFPIILWLYHFLHFILLFILTINGNYQFVLTVILIKTVLETIMLSRVAKNFNYSISPIHVFIMQFLYSPYVVILGLLSQFVKYNWR